MYRVVECTKTKSRNTGVEVVHQIAGAAKLRVAQMRKFRLSNPDISDNLLTAYSGLTYEWYYPISLIITVGIIISYLTYILGFHYHTIALKTTEAHSTAKKSLSSDSRCRSIYMYHLHLFCSQGQFEILGRGCYIQRLCMPHPRLLSFFPTL